MASSWRYGKRNKYRTKVTQDPEDFYQLDAKKSSSENAYDIYTELCSHDTRDTKRLYLLNALATLCEKQQKQQFDSSKLESTTNVLPLNKQQQQQKSEKYHLGFTTEELLLCLSACLVHTFTQVRAAALRTCRYVVVDVKDVKVFNGMQLPHFLCRSIDIMLKNDDERVQALKLIRKILAISPNDLSPVIIRCLVSLADTGIEDSDNLLRACLATLCECAVLNPTTLIMCGGVTSITRNIMECHNPRIAESLCGVLLYLLEWPNTRNICGVRLDCLAAPYCDFTYRLGIMDKNKDARELRYTSCRLALLSVLRSWTGTIEFCDPSKPSALKAIFDALYLNQNEVRKAILDLLYELLGVPQPAWTDDYAIALQSVDPSDFQDTWLLAHGFVAAEGRTILPSLAARAPNICTQHLALQLYCFLETGILNALTEVIVSSDVHMSVLATVLIGKLLQLMHTHLPADICSNSSSLPTLILKATQGNRNACAAITALQDYQKILRNRPAACSLFLDCIMKGGALIHSRIFHRDAEAQHQFGHVEGNNNGMGTAAYNQMSGGTLSYGTVSGGGTLERRQRLDSVSSSEDSQTQSSSRLSSSFRLKRKFLPFLENLRINFLIKNSHVLLLSDPNSWDWEVVMNILRSNLLRKLDDNSGKFVKALVNYFKPSSNRFSHQDLVPGNPPPVYILAGLDLIDWLLASNEFESLRLLTDFFSDVSHHLLAVTTNRAHDCLFSPQHMSNTMCQIYFLFIGRMCRLQKGIVILNNTAVFEHFINLIRNSEHVCYVKLIVSGMDYTLESVTRKVLEKALTSAKTRSGRLYATQFLLVLLRARIVNFEVWGLPLIIQQTRDVDRAVVLAAMDVFEEACHEKYYLEEIVSLWPNLKSSGDVGRLLMARYYSLPRGLNNSMARIKEEIEYWKQGFNKRYVLLVESQTHASLTLHIRNEDGYYSKRNCNSRPIIVPPNIAPHLYGQLVQTTQGTTALRKYGDLAQLVELIFKGKCSDVAECLELKVALWAVGHASTHSNGIEYLLELCSLRAYEKIVLLATKCEVYSIRATAFNVLGLIGGTHAGANILLKLNWLSVRHDRNTLWPVHQPDEWLSNNYTPVRHQYEEEMPPYNYSGMEDQIDGSYYTDSCWNLLLNSTTTTTKEVSGTSISGGVAAVGAASSTRSADETTITNNGANTKATFAVLKDGTAKSRTLPEGTHMRYGRHQRSLSESKTADVINLNWTGVNTAGTTVHQYAQQHRIRYNSCTDSNTSGVSSCESVTGRAAVTSEFQQFPLSPIPSLSNLMELPRIGNTSSLFRRTSLLGNTAYMTQQSISPIDIRGYAQLRSLRRHCRPVLSESATDFYDVLQRNELVMPYTSNQPTRSSFNDSQHRLKVRSLDRQSNLRMCSNLDIDEVQVSLTTTATASKFLTQNDTKGPCYAGISLPKNLLDLFPQRNLSHSYVLHDLQQEQQELTSDDINVLTAKQQFLNDSLNNDIYGDESSVISSLSDISSSASKQQQQQQQRAKCVGSKHARNNCLYCCRMRRINRLHQQHYKQQSSDNNNETQIAACEIYSNASALLIAAGIQAVETLTRKSYAKQQQKQQEIKSVHSTTVGNSFADISFNSPESILSEESIPDRLAANILYNVQRLANPVSAKQSKMALLELKQKHPSSFQDICLYSEVCKTLGRGSYRMTARRFLQELFLDLNIEYAFYAEPLEILSRKERYFQNQHNNNTAVVDVMSDANENNAAVVVITNNSDLVADNSKQQLTSKVGAVSINNSSYKTALHKLQPLASVYESSCENLLQEQQQGKAMAENKIDEDTVDCNGVMAVKEKCFSNQRNLTNNVSGKIIVENENKKFTRGRFYTLELDLSCTKNKFPITDRTSRGEEINMRRWTSGGDDTIQIQKMLSKSLQLQADETVKNLNKTPTTTTTNNKNINTSDNSLTNNHCNIGKTNTNIQKTSKIIYNNNNIPIVTATPVSTAYNITKSLAASFVKPIGSLYCEKRLLKTSRSEALLNSAPTIVQSDMSSTTTTAASGSDGDF